MKTNIKPRFKGKSLGVIALAIGAMMTVSTPVFAQDFDVWGPSDPAPSSPPVLVTGQVEPSTGKDSHALPPRIEDIPVFDGASGPVPASSIMTTAWPTATGFNSPFTPLFSLVTCFALGMGGALLAPKARSKMASN